MLERVSPSAECAAHILLRRFEAPIRSNRVLETAFWRNGSEDINVPAWWPSYLDSVRSKSQVAPCVSHSRLSSSHGTPVAARSNGSKFLNKSTRTFANSTSKAQVAAAHAGLDQDDNLGVKIYAGGKRSSTETVRAVRSNEYEPDQRNILRRARSGGKDGTHLEKAWDDLMKDSRKSNASTAMHLLATGKDPRNLDRALSAFDLIPENRRAAKDYRTAVDVSTRLGRYSVTLRLMKQAVARNRSQGVFFEYLAFCVSNSLWTTAAELWKTVAKDELQVVALDPTSYKQNFAGQFSSSFDVVSDLPLKVVTLANRLSENDLILAPHHSNLRELCKELALLTVESEKTMRLITENGMMSLLDLQSKLGFDSKLHFAALATLHRISNSRIRNQLAMLIYKDFKSVQSKKVPKWIIGTMIDMCSIGKHNPAVYRSLLEDYRQAYGTPDRRIYLRVMRACADQGEANEVSTIFTEFCKHYRPDVADDLNPLIRAHAITGNHQGAQKEFDRVATEFGLEQSVRNWNALILAYSRAGDHNQAYQKFREMRRTHLTPDKYTWSMVVALASKKGDTKHARNLVAEAQEAGIAPSLPMIGAVVDSCLLNGDTKEASSLIIETTRALKSGPFEESPVRLWNSLFRFHAFRADSWAIAQTQEEMKELGVEADGMTYAALMTALVVQGRTDDAAHILRTMNFSQVLSATAFHYSILIHGYAVEKKRDQAQILYREMIANFQRATPSAKLAMLYLQGTRDEEKSRTEYLAGGPNLKPDFRPTLDNLKEILADTSMSDMASSIPNPGFGRRSSPGDLERAYLSTLVKFLHRNNAYDSSETIMQTFGQIRGSLTPNVTASGPSWLSLLDALSDALEVSVAAQNWVGTSRTWQQIMEVTLKNCVSLKREERLPATNFPIGSGTHNVKFIGNTSSQFSDMISQAPRLSTSVLPAHQYVLSRPLSQYIAALDRQQEYEQLITTMQTLRDRGFNLSGKNWNHLIQALCRSANKQHGVFAFQLFERVLLENSPSWDVIRRGKWVLPSIERDGKWDKLLKKRDDRKSRKLLEKHIPDLTMPTYYTMVHLAIVWLNISKSSSEDSYALRRQLEARSPGTVKVVLKTPYLGDKIQGVLLRGRQTVGDLSKRPRQPQADSGFAGIQGSQLLVDQISPDARMDLETSILLDDTSQKNDNRKDKLEKAESILGQVYRSPVILPSKGRLETHQERRKRIVAAERRKLSDYKTLIRQAHDNSELGPPMVGTMARGQTPSGHHNAILQVSNKNKKQPYDEQQSAAFHKVNTILRRVGKKSLHGPSEIYARHHIPKVRTNTLSTPLAVRLGVSAAEQDFLIARALRRRKYINKSKASKARSETLIRRQKLALQQPKKPTQREIMRAKRLALKGDTRSAIDIVHPAGAVPSTQHVTLGHTKRRLVQFKPKSSISERLFMAPLKKLLRRSR